MQKDALVQLGQKYKETSYGSVKSKFIRVGLLGATTL